MNRRHKNLGLASISGHPRLRGDGVVVPQTPRHPRLCWFALVKAGMVDVATVSDAQDGTQEHKQLAVRCCSLVRMQKTRFAPTSANERA